MDPVSGSAGQARGDGDGRAASSIAAWSRFCTEMARAGAPIAANDAPVEAACSGARRAHHVESGPDA